ncbi:MAG: RNA polymerase sigma factor [Planctomycetota bacterium]|nr:RNA polymerase sigma factor [Planctomycetota bacterium]
MKADLVMTAGPIGLAPAFGLPSRSACAGWLGALALLDATAAWTESRGVGTDANATAGSDAGATSADALDRADVLASQGGDGGAYARLVARHQDALVIRMRRFARGPAAVEELVQEIFVEAYFSLGSYRGSAPFAHWLGRIATRVGYRAWRRGQARKTVALADWDGSADERRDGPGSGASAEAREAAEELHDLLEALPPRDRLVLTLLYLEERSVAEAASLAGWSATMVKVQAFRARGKLKRLMAKRDVERAGRPKDIAQQREPR